MQDNRFVELERVARLRELTAEENDLFSEESARELMQFIMDPMIRREPAVFVILNGNLRAVWEDKLTGQIGIQFIPGGILQYVILYPGRRTTIDDRNIQSNLLQCMGTIDVEDKYVLDSILGHLGLSHLWAEERDEDCS